MRVALLGHPGQMLARELVERWRPYLAAHAEIVAEDFSLESDLSDLEADLVVAFGGDGFMLSVARRLGPARTPVAGVNTGGLGFLAEIEPAELEFQLGRILAGHGRLERRMMLAAAVLRDGRERFSGTALNDAVVTRGGRVHMVELTIAVDGEFVARLQGDGVIVSTPTGSTAYSLSSGGPIISPRLDKLVLTPVCAHTLGARPLVLGKQQVLSLRITAGPDTTCLTLDGQVHQELRPRDVVVVRDAGREFCLLSASERSHYACLREKLGWGIAAENEPPV